VALLAGKLCQLFRHCENEKKIFANKKIMTTMVASDCQFLELFGNFVKKIGSKIFGDFFPRSKKSS